MNHRVTTTVGKHDLIIETGKIARQASGAVTIRYGDTIVLVTAVHGREDVTGQDFFPLIVDYREKSYAAGKIPGGFFKREGRPNEKEVLSSRLIDRTIRPLFPKDFRRDVQVIANVLSSDQENDSDVLAVIGASAALSISPIPFDGPVSAVRVGKIDGQLVANPTFAEIDDSSIDMIVACRGGAVLMVEGGTKEVSEAELLEALQFAVDVCNDVERSQRELVETCGLPKVAVEPVEVNPELERRVRDGFADRISAANRNPDKEPRQEELNRITSEAVERMSEEFPESESDVTRLLGDVEREDLRKMILEEGVRSDGRRHDQVREITCEIGVLPRTHGSGLFTRGQTQSLVVTTLGTSMDEQKLDELEGISWKSYMLHYNFPPFSVGETRMMRGPGRREIGHGALAERAIEPVIPSDEVFPYTIRIVSDILESNGSSSMATVCGGSLSLMDAGVPIKNAVAGVAMGLVKEGDKTAILTDILGVEDHLGDMDFKVTGTEQGITAFQMDVKIGGIGPDLMREALDRAHVARMGILEIMNKTISKPREELSRYAPRITVLRIETDRIKDLIGPGGRNIKRISEETGANIEIEDDGEVKVAAYDQEGGDRAIEMIKSITEDPEVGRIYRGKVKRIVSFGAFVEIVPGRDGLVHISELDRGRVNSVEEVVSEGDVVTVKVIGIDREGKIRLSRKAALDVQPAVKNSE
jgi:polyribonucleotide nucleotidyltransferase